jgi:hypothetical protein
MKPRTDDRFQPVIRQAQREASTLRAALLVRNVITHNAARSLFPADVTAEMIQLTSKVIPPVW